MNRPWISRRSFLGGAAYIAALGFGLRAPRDGSRIALVRGLRPNARWHEAQRAINLGLEKCIGQNAIAAWTSAMVAKGSISLKIDTRSPLAHTGENLIAALLRTLVEQGIPPREIAVWDQRASDVLRLGMRLQTGSGSVPIRWIEAANARGEVTTGYSEDFAYNPEWLEDESHASNFAGLLTPPPPVLINMPAAKHHPGLGVHGALASLALAAVNRTGRFLSSAEGLTRAICEIWQGEPLRSHTLTVMDATHIVFHGGPVGLPGWTAPDSSLIIGTDPVAVDTVALRLIDGRRVAAMLPSCFETGQAFLKAAEEARLGSTSPQVVEVTLPSF